MDGETANEVHGINLTSLLGNSQGLGSSRKNSLRLSAAGSFRVNEDAECDRVSEAGDVGDLCLQNRRMSENKSNRFSFDTLMKNEAVYPVTDDKMLELNESWRYDPAILNVVSLASQQTQDLLSSLSTDGLVKEAGVETEELLVLSPLIEYLSCLLHLAVFGILGVLTRYYLKKLFGPDVAGVTSDHSPLYPDLPSNMVGSFLMGWWGVVFKGDITKMSNHLAIGLTTGYLGSLTTFSGWNQKMLDLSLDGQWIISILGFLLGLFLAAYSIKFGVGTAHCFKSLLNLRSKDTPLCDWRVNTLKRHYLVMIFIAIMLSSIWVASAILLKKQFAHHTSEAELWIAFLVAPPGVWIRWFLARLNGSGIGKRNILKWIPFGTLLANVVACCIMAALATSKRVAHKENTDTVASGIQLGFLGALSTVSTFMAEYHAMENSPKHWRAYAYALVTIILSFGCGLLIFYVPLRIKGY